MHNDRNKYFSAIVSRDPILGSVNPQKSTNGGGCEHLKKIPIAVACGGYVAERSRREYLPLCAGHLQRNTIAIIR